MAEPLDPAGVAGMLAEPDRLRVFAAVALGAATLEAVGSAAEVPAATAVKALERLVGSGVVEWGDGGYRVAVERLKATAQTKGANHRTSPIPGAEGLAAGQVQVLRSFVVDGRLVSIPASRSKRLVVLDWLAGRFEPGVTYPERDVNFLIGTVFPDYAALRRYLVDEGFLERRDGFYWRAGGTVAD